MKSWRMVLELLQDMANADPTRFRELDVIYKRIKLAHYEEIYG